MKTLEQIQQLKGNYTFKSPYHKGIKRLPFNITGRETYNPDFPVEVNTCQYRGWEREDITTGYTVESVRQKISSGFLKPVKA